MGGRKGVVDLEVPIGRQFARESRVVGLLAGMEAKVLEEGDAAGFQTIHNALGVRAEQSLAKAMGLPSSADRGSTTCPRLIDGVGIPFGRPKCESNTTFAPRALR